MDDPNQSVSVIIPAFNSAATIRRAIDSVLAQTRPADQIIVVDDGSTDGTAVLVSEFGGRIDYFWQPNAGVGAARNFGIREAKNRWIAFLDADDEWLPERLQRQFEMLRAHPDLVWITGNYLRRDSQGTNSPAFRRADQSLRSETTSFFAAFLQNRWGCTDTMLIRREVFERVGEFACQLRFTEDLDMWFRIAFEDPRIGVVEDPLAVYSLDTPNSLVKSRAWNVDAMIQFLDRNLRSAQDHGKADEFRPCASLLLRTWIRGMLFAGQGRQAKGLANGFRYLLPLHYRMLVWFGRLVPGLTASCLRSASRLARRLGLPGRATRTFIF